MKTHYKRLFNPDYIGAYSLDGKESMTVTIESVAREMITGTGGKKEECPVAKLKDNKPFILNSTNAKRIAKLAKSSYIEDWAGLTIRLYVDIISAFGERNVEALRVDPKPVEKEALTPSHPKWDAAVKAIKAGNTTLEQIKTKYTITDADAKKL